jgi:hypothetical protein
MQSAGFSEISVHIYHCYENGDLTNINETDRYLGGAELMYLSIWFFIILGYCQRQQIILQDLFLPLWRLNNKLLRILHDRWVLTVTFAINDTVFDDGSEGLLSQLQEEENRPYCKFYCFFNGNAI